MRENLATSRENSSTRPDEVLGRSMDYTTYVIHKLRVEAEGIT